MLLMIDNYDSFTYNLVQYFGELNQRVQVFRNDQIKITDIDSLKPKYIVLSPGPCTPNEAGISLAVIKAFKTQIPILGVCLGHQAIGQAFGGKIVAASKIMHGKTSLVKHNGKGIFKGLNNPLTATRYHSLVVDKNILPDCLEITAWTETQDGTMDEIMAFKHNTLRIQGVQFHPESIMTEQGHKLLNNFLEQNQ